MDLLAESEAEDTGSQFDLIISDPMQERETHAIVVKQADIGDESQNPNPVSTSAQPSKKKKFKGKRFEKREGGTAKPAMAFKYVNEDSTVKTKEKQQREKLNLCAYCAGSHRCSSSSFRPFTIGKSLSETSEVLLQPHSINRAHLCTLNTEEAQTDRLDYDLRGWEPVEYEYLKVYPAVNSESKISEYTEDGDLIRVKRPKTYFCLTWISPNKK
ncbi:hypothetical protein PPACK8108_LOCUS12142 [Phakopsora pachyrhizi]|uniref:Uncharacterized protein n=1 Tax=Phakopsora pachyrhizi TaxID=170000 RepID=A0AAV0B1B8_PHAPC|nr:hypothetical protein PPACK8108_LOCUS12142 [Phakopsora pachyrhizi]